MAFSQPEVAARLGLTDEQRQTIRQIEMEAFALMWDPLDAENRKPAAGDSQETILRAAMAKALAVLTPEQLAEWKKTIGPPFEGAYELPPPGPPFPP